MYLSSGPWQRGRRQESLIFAQSWSFTFSLRYVHSPQDLVVYILPVHCWSNRCRLEHTSALLTNSKSFSSQFQPKYFLKVWKCEFPSFALKAPSRLTSSCSDSCWEWGLKGCITLNSVSCLEDHPGNWFCFHSVLVITLRNVAILSTRG